VCVRGHFPASPQGEVGKVFKSEIDKNVCMEMCVRKAGKTCKKMGFVLVALLMAVMAKAQSGEAGIEEANTQVRSYFAAGTNLMYAIGAIVGLIGAVKV